MSNYLIHYASKYYDPVKAHEYYMKNRELKGRMSTSGLNEEGRKVADYVKSQINSERKQKIETHKEQTDEKVESLQNQKANSIEMHKEQMNAKIEDLRESLKSMPAGQKAANRQRIMMQIDGLRQENQVERARLQEEFQGNRNQLRTDHAIEKGRLNEEYDNKIGDEMDKIKSESRYRAAKKGGRKQVYGNSKPAKKEESKAKTGIPLNMNLQADREHVEREKREKAIKK